MLGCHTAAPPRPSTPPSTLAATRQAFEEADEHPATVTPEWLMLQIADLDKMGADTTLPNTERAEAYVLAAKGEGLLIEHFTTLFWNKAEPGRQVIAYLRQALVLDPNSESAAIAYTFSILGVRNSGFRSQAEDAMDMKTTPELTRMAPMLARHEQSLLAQSVLRAALDALATDGPLPPETEPLRAGLDARIARLRTRDAG
ncbi:MAG TPA: hypothetical protein VLC93_02130, partial [Myxococcota bacterium]|nr:hypothetical protein [Myxococcota bacterium]